MGKALFISIIGLLFFTRHTRPIGITAPKRRLLPDPVSEGASTRLLHTPLPVERQPS
jgi:hypothetical protein